MYPVLFRIGGLAVPTYAIVVLAAMMVGYALLPRSARRNGMDPKIAIPMYFVVVGMGVVGARLLHVLLLLPEIVREPRLAATILVSGGVWYGGVIAGIVSGWLYLRHHRIDFFIGLDTFAVPVIVGGALGRIACFLSGCCFGSPTALPWGVTYRDPVAHRLHADLPYVALHPVQLYEMAGALGVAWYLDWLAARPHRRGTIGLLWMVLYGAVRVVVEGFRGDAVRGTLLGSLSTSQIIAFVTAALALFALGVRRSAPVVAASEG
ncbi:MAG TPA: prolipoprotein diacylglyceryl transferase family protein [Candidatus Polarisedimenticolaceae bacterium]|nr:prolipoprotein diacylglyceryl transferase family protein [Candidatus Polarisedimenticolaceae bacterium]